MTPKGKARRFIMVPTDFFLGDFWTRNKKYTDREAALDLQSMANYEDKIFYVRGKTIHLKSGEFVASVRFLETRWHWSKTKVMTFLKTQKQVHGLEHRSEQGETVLKFDLLKAYGCYENLESTETRTPNGTQSGTENGTETGTPNGTQSGTKPILKDGNMVIHIPLPELILRVAQIIVKKAKIPRPKKEMAAWKNMKTKPTVEEVELVEWFYVQPKSEDYDETWHRKKDVPTLLNNWQAICEAASQFRDRKSAGGDLAQKKSPPHPNDDPADWVPPPAA